jgi:hypothetical protein
LGDFEDPNLYPLKANKGSKFVGVVVVTQKPYQLLLPQ